MHWHDKIRAVLGKEPFQVGFGVALDDRPPLGMVAVDQPVVVLDVFLVGAQQEVVKVAARTGERTTLFQGMRCMDEKPNAFCNFGQPRF